MGEPIGEQKDDDDEPHLEQAHPPASPIGGGRNAPGRRRPEPLGQRRRPQPKLGLPLHLAVPLSAGSGRAIHAMIKIAISVETFEAIASKLPFGGA
jgi:hypothetical protein